MENFSRFYFEFQEGHRKLMRYRLEAAQRRLVPYTPWRAWVARGLHSLAERLESTSQSPKTTPLERSTL